MPPRLNIWGACRSMAVRPRPVANLNLSAPRLAALARPSPASSRSYSDLPTQPPRIPEQSQPSSSLSASSSLSPSKAASSNDLSGRKFARDMGEEVFPEPDSEENIDALRQLQLASYGLNPYDPDVVGHKFGMPNLPLEKDNHPKFRYEPVVVQITRLLMRDGKLSKAQRDMAMILNYLRTAPPPKYNPQKPLLPGAPPSSHLPLDPVLYLQLAIDSVAPLFRMRAIKGAAGGGQALEFPHPLGVRQRRRVAFQWILDNVKRKPSKGSGRTMFPHRVGEEIVAVVEGRSGVWDRRLILHKKGVALRANLTNRHVTGGRK